MRCKEELPLVERVQKKFEEEGLVVLAMGFQDTRANIEEDVENLKLKHITFGYDEGDKVAKKYGITYVAASVFINKKGVVSRRLTTGFNEPQLLKEIYRIVN